MDKICPVCQKNLDVARRIEVCGSCYEELQAAGAVPVSRTGEFAAVSTEAAEQLLHGSTIEAPVASGSDTVCTWCSRPAAKVKKMLSSNGAHICNECVALCSDILVAELGDDWAR